jgi:hypothetical protein
VALVNTIASVPESEVRAFRRDPKSVVKASLIGRLSSFNMGGWSDPLGVLLQEAMLKGEVIDPAPPHDRDLPRFHAPRRVCDLRRRMHLAAREAGPVYDDPNRYESFARSEFLEALRIVDNAAIRDECVITAWEFGVPIRLRLRSLSDDPTWTTPRPLWIAGALAASLLAGVLWRQRRMSARCETR